MWKKAAQEAIEAVPIDRFYQFRKHTLPMLLDTNINYETAERTSITSSLGGGQS
jgi:hypothetical protein